MNALRDIAAAGITGLIVMTYLIALLLILLTVCGIVSWL